MIPHERKMVEKFANKPFVLLGINSDESRSALKKIMNKEGIAWPNIYDGKEGAIAKKWNVHGWPTIYVIDQQGVIRHRDLRDEQLEQAVSDLLENDRSKKKD